MRKIAVDINILKLINKAVDRFVYGDTFTEAENEVREAADTAMEGLGPALQEAVDTKVNLGDNLVTAISKQQQPQSPQTPAPETKPEPTPASKEAPVDDYTAFKQKFDNEQ